MSLEESLDSLASAVERKLAEVDELRARAGALESQVKILEQAAVDPRVHDAYRRAAVVLVAYVESARGSRDAEHRRRVLELWGDLADELSQHLALERVH